jgi:hypothetical protein
MTYSRSSYGYIGWFQYYRALRCNQYNRQAQFHGRDTTHMITVQTQVSELFCDYKRADIISRLLILQTQRQQLTTAAYGRRANSHADDEHRHRTDMLLTSNTDTVPLSLWPLANLLCPSCNTYPLHTPYPSLLSGSGFGCCCCYYCCRLLRRPLLV